MSECKYAKDIGIPEYRCAVKCMHNDYFPKRLAYEEIVNIMDELKINPHESLFHDFAHSIMDKLLEDASTHRS